TWALVADEGLGFGRALGDTDNIDADLPLATQGVLAALREEDRSGMDPVELESFLQDAATLESRYKAMLGQLAAGGTNVVRYGRDDHADLVGTFANLNLQILGPTEEHLVICAEAVAKATNAARDELITRFRTDNLADAVEVYRTL